MAARLCKLLGTRLPIVQGPMAGVTDPRMVAACSKAGVLGAHGAAGRTPDQIRGDIRAIRETLSGGESFLVNLFVIRAQPSFDTNEQDAGLSAVAPLREKVGLPPAASFPDQLAPDFADQLATVRELAPPVVSTTFGALTPEEVRDLHEAGCVVLGTATTVAEARHLEATGVDAIVAQGAEAGGHRGTFLSKRWDFGDSLIGTMALVPQVVDAVEVPVIAAGGIADGRGIAAALALGAAGVQMGTAFLRCDEASITAGWKHLVGDPVRGADTVLTRGISGRWARGVRNELSEMSSDQKALTYPGHNALTTPVRAAAKKANNVEMLSLWAGQAGPLTKSGSAQSVVAALEEGLSSALGKLSAAKL
eukprot:Hpha_TRINITY_DN6094_c0_g1::TRINITY_DN6094_c0_g1_i1::g.63466::m.63466/K00459/ncd2, npd; nitronate monooxygenase